MGLGGQQAAGEAPPRSALRAWNLGRRRAPAARVAAHLVEREQAQVAVEGGVLDALGHHRAGRLLEAGDEGLLVGSRGDQRLAHAVGQLGLLDRLDVVGLDLPRGGST